MNFEQRVELWLLLFDDWFWSVSKDEVVILPKFKLVSSSRRLPCPELLLWLALDKSKGDSIVIGEVGVLWPADIAFLIFLLFGVAGKAGK